jgi:surface antigen
VVQSLELAVIADSKEVLDQILQSIGFSGAKIINFTEVSELFLVKVEATTPLKDQDYKKINEHEKVGIVDDSASRERSKEILDLVYSVESLLRKLLLHISDSVETYFQVIKPKHTKWQSAVAIPKKLDVITSHLTLGQTLEILPTDAAAWKRDRSLTADDLLFLLNGVGDLTALKNELENKLRVTVIWNVISEKLLQDPVEWDEIKGDLNCLFTIRNEAAHYRTIRPSELYQVRKISSQLTQKIKPKELSDEEQKELMRTDKELSESIQKSLINGGYPQYWADGPLDALVDSWGFYNRESVSYAAWKVYVFHGRSLAGWGNANQWPAAARAAGLLVDNKPRAGDVAIREVGYYGHVMYVESVNNDGTINVSQYNADWNGTFSYANNISTGGLTFVHF